MAIGLRWAGSRHLPRIGNRQWIAGRASPRRTGQSAG